MKVKGMRLLCAVFFLCVLPAAHAQNASASTNPSLEKVKLKLTQLNAELKDIDTQIAHVSADSKLYEQALKDGSWNKYQEVKSAKKAEIVEWENIKHSLEQNSGVKTEKIKVSRAEFNTLPAANQQAMLNDPNYQIVD